MGRIYHVTPVVDPQGVIIDNTLSTTSENPVQNKVITQELNNKANTSSLGTASSKDVPSSGNASTTEVVMGNDSRLTDARTPVSHTHTKSDITDFPSVDTTVTSGSGNLITSGAVYTAIDNLPEPMIFKGTLGTGGTITELPTAVAANEGFTYKVITANTYSSIECKVGDVVVSNGTSWVLIPAGDTDSDSWRNIKINGTEQLGSALSSGSVDFVNGTNTTVAFDANGNKISISVPAVSASNAGVAPQGASVSSQSQSTKFLREDGSWAAPSYTKLVLPVNPTTDPTEDGAIWIRVS